jgi:hypothetical protein
MIVDYTAGDPTPIASVRAALHSGSGLQGYSWDGPGIISSTAAGQTGVAIGYGEAAAFSPAARSTFFPGDPINIDDSAVLLRYTIRGDATLDGKVDFNDLVALAQNYASPLGTKFWMQGDFNYDGTVDFGDLVILAQHYNGALAPVPGVTPQFESDVAKAFAQVPEPATLATVALAAAALTTTRRRRKKLTLT